MAGRERLSLTKAKLRSGKSSDDTGGRLASLGHSSKVRHLSDIRNPSSGFCHRTDASVIKSLARKPSIDEAASEDPSDWNKQNALKKFSQDFELLGGGSSPVEGSRLCIARKAGDAHQKSIREISMEGAGFGTGRESHSTKAHPVFPNLDSSSQHPSAAPRRVWDMLQSSPDLATTNPEIMFQSSGSIGFPATTDLTGGSTGPSGVLRRNARMDAIFAKSLPRRPLQRNQFLSSMSADQSNVCRMGQLLDGRRSMSRSTAVSRYAVGPEKVGGLQTSDRLTGPPAPSTSQFPFNSLTRVTELLGNASRLSVTGAFDKEVGAIGSGDQLLSAHSSAIGDLPVSVPLETFVLKLKEENDSLRERLRAADIAAFTAKVDQERRMSKTAEAKIRSVQLERKRLQEDISHLKAQIQQRDETVTQLHQHIRYLEQTPVRAESMLVTVRSPPSTAQSGARVDALEKQVGHLELELSLANRTIEDLNAQLDCFLGVSKAGPGAAKHGAFLLAARPSTDTFSGIRLGEETYALSAVRPQGTPLPDSIVGTSGGLADGPDGGYGVSSHLSGTPDRQPDPSSLADTTCNAVATASSNAAVPARRVYSKDLQQRSTAEAQHHFGGSTLSATPGARSANCSPDSQKSVRFSADSPDGGCPKSDASLPASVAHSSPTSLPGTLGRPQTSGGVVYDGVRGSKGKGVSKKPKRSATRSSPTPTTSSAAAEDSVAVAVTGSSPQCPDALRGPRTPDSPEWPAEPFGGRTVGAGQSTATFAEVRTMRTLLLKPTTLVNKDGQQQSQGILPLMLSPLNYVTNPPSFNALGYTNNPFQQDFQQGPSGYNAQQRFSEDSTLPRTSLNLAADLHDLPPQSGETVGSAAATTPAFSSPVRLMDGPVKFWEETLRADSMASTVNMNVAPVLVPLPSGSIDMSPSDASHDTESHEV